MLKHKITISLSYSLLMVSLLMQAGETTFDSGKSHPATHTTVDASLMGVSNIPTTNQDPPLPDRLIVRFKPLIANSLYSVLARASNSNLKQNPTMIGNRLELNVLEDKAPQLAGILEQYQVRAADSIDPVGGSYLIRTQGGANIVAFREALEASQTTIYTEFDYPVRAFKEPDDPIYRSGRQWGLAQIDAPDAWDVMTGTNKITLAIVDSGVGSHPELKGRILNGFNFVSDPASLDTNDDYGHGTYVAGIAAATGDNNDGIAGVDWNAMILPVKVLNSQGVGSNATIAMGIRYATDQGANVINMSLGGNSRSNIVQEAVSYAANPVDIRVSRAESQTEIAKAERSVILIASVANKSQNKITDVTDPRIVNKPAYPAAYDEVIAVGATDGQDAPLTTSSYGPELALCAPGYSIVSLDWKPDSNTPAYSVGSGTSSAAPFVSGTAALMLAINPHLNDSQIRNILEGTADFKTTVPPVFGNTSSTAPATPTPVVNPDGADKAMSAPTPAARSSSDGRLYDTHLGWGRLNAYKAVEAVSNGVEFPNRRARIYGTITGLARKDENGLDAGNVLVTLTPGDQRFLSADGSFSFDNIPPGSYSLQVSAPKFGLEPKPVPIQIDGAENETKQYNFNLSEANNLLFKDQAVGAFAAVPADPMRFTDKNYTYFPDTHHSLTNTSKFKDFWETNGGLPTFGLPISEEFVENGRVVQYFERAVFEYHTEVAGTKAEVQLALLGNLVGATRSQETPFKPIAAFASTDNRVFFDKTGHSISNVNGFLKYWQSNNGELVFGFPISEPFSEKAGNGMAYTVQYFQRAKMEWHPATGNTAGHIELGLLGLLSAQAQGVMGKQP